MDERLLTIDVSDVDAVRARMQSAFRGQVAASPRYSFGSVVAMARTMTPNRWLIIEALTGAGPLGVRELARRTDRDVKTVHTDAQALVLCGLIDKLNDGKLSFPYDAVEVHFAVRGKVAA